MFAIANYHWEEFLVWPGEGLGVSNSVWSDQETKPNITLETQNYRVSNTDYGWGQSDGATLFYKSNCQAMDNNNTISIKTTTTNTTIETTKTQQMFSSQLSLLAGGSIFRLYLWGLQPPPRTPPSERVPCSGLLNSGKHCQLNCSLIIVPTFVIVWLNLVNISVGPGDMITSAPLLHLRAESHYRHNTNLHSFIFYCTEAHDMDNIM